MPHRHLHIHVCFCTYHNNYKWNQPRYPQQMIELFSSVICICNDIYGKESVNIIPYKCINLDFDINQECQYDIRYGKQLQSSKRE